MVECLTFNWVVNPHDASVQNSQLSLPLESMNPKSYRLESLDKKYTTEFLQKVHVSKGNEEKAIEGTQKVY